MKRPFLHKHIRMSVAEMVAYWETPIEHVDYSFEYVLMGT